MYVRKKTIIIAVGLVVGTIVLSIAFKYLFDFLFKPRIVFGAKGFTEYSPGDNGRVFVQVLDNFFTPVSNAICTVTSYFPNNTVFFSGIMTYFDKGLYYYDFVAPDTLGVYMTTIECVYPQLRQSIFPALSQLYYIDNQLYSGTSLTITFPTITGFEDTYFEAYFRTVPTAGANIYLLNRCNNRYELVATATQNTPQISRMFSLNCTNPPQFLVNSTSRIDLDMFVIYGFTNATSTITNLRGGGEIHVKLVKGEFYPSENIPSIHIISWFYEAV